ncbi:unnamed protein product [Ectocarpus sp. 4 AP-2014]|uniref:EsV-1-214 n=1 Tax=Ectocarpus siliculosus virus 1 (isolate New Zealand/Kaikoura/1988) TaxID=654926 RepID=Q8QN76_ESV1K|nr:EsV-1-214 [Ectocarpus siliculosus virus 1]AAK14628.1 EsV-1-214 [Ectocarpus siliculosus virus 1]
MFVAPAEQGAPADAPTTEQREASGGIDAAAETGGDDGLDTTDRGNGWYVVGKSRRTTTGSEVRTHWAPIFLLLLEGSVAVFMVWRA